MEIIDFLRESNAIEREYSDLALRDSVTAWQYAHKMIIKKNEPISKRVIIGVHKRLLINLNDRIAGKFRRIQVGVQIKDEFHEAIHWTQINDKIKDWCDVFNKDTKEQYKNWKGNHVWFEKIHPFIDGNGRTGRILMNIQRLKFGLPLLVIHEGKEQREYYKWFAEERKEVTAK